MPSIPESQVKTAARQLLLGFEIISQCLYSQVLLDYTRMGKLQAQTFKTSSRSVTSFFSQLIIMLSIWCYAYRLLPLFPRCLMGQMNSPMHTEKRRVYDRSADTSGNDSLGKIFRRLAKNSDVLDIGVGCGALAIMVKENLIGQIDAVDNSREALEQTRRHYRDVFLLDLDVVPLKSALGQRRYDFVVAADLIEHLRFPEKILLQLHEFLKPGGKILLSVPNVTYFGLVAALAAGEFLYRPEGLLDSTHLRFFSWSSLCALLEKCMLQIVHTDVVSIPFEQTEFAEHLPDKYLKLDEIMKREHSQTYQFIVEAISSKA